MRELFNGRVTADMFQCHVCGSTEAHQECVSEVFMIEGKRVLVENIPASVCARCGEATLSRETTERIRRMLHGEAKPVRAEMMEVFSYAWCLNRPGATVREQFDPHQPG